MEIPIGKRIEGERVTSAETCLSLRTLTLHGLIGGSTGTGKSKAIQVIAEKLNEQGIPVLLADIKGDMEGFIRPGDSDIAKKRAKKLGMEHSPRAFPTDFFSVSGDSVPLRLRVGDMDPSLIARILKLNATQESNLRIAFLYAKKEGIPLRDLTDLKEVLSHLAEEPAAGMGNSSLNVIIRQLSIAIGEGMDALFGEPPIEVSDLLTPRVHVLDLSNWRKRSDFPAILMAFIMYRLFHELDDVGQLEKPRIVLFIDEAHYLFQKANPELTALFITILKQIRSKGVSVFLSSQNPEDIPEKVLEQLGCKIQFALRAFTKSEMEDIKGIAKSFPPTKQYDLAQEILSLKIAEAFVSPLDGKGRPMPPAKTAIFAPMSSMDVLPVADIAAAIDPALKGKYAAVPLERFDLSEPLKRIKVERRSGWGAARKEARKYERKQSLMVSRHWKRLKMVGLFLLAFLILLIIVILLLLVLLK